MLDRPRGLGRAGQGLSSQKGEEVGLGQKSTQPAAAKARIDVCVMGLTPQRSQHILRPEAS